MFELVRAKNMVVRDGIDLVLFAKFKVGDYGIKQKFLEFLKERKVKSAMWTWDLYFGLQRSSLLRSDPVFKCDFVFTPDGGNQAEFEKLGINHKLLRQGIYEDYCVRGTPEEKYTNDIVFVGCVNPQWRFREDVCASLKKYDFRRYGGDDTYEVRGGRLNALYSSVKIVVGDSVYSPHYWSNRIYETLGRGGFLIHPMIEGLEKEYEPYKHFIPFKYGDIESLHEKIDYYLAHPEERKKIANAAFEHTKQKHTVKHRCEELLKHIV